MFQLAIADRVARLTLDRAPVNAMNDAWTGELHRVLDGLEARDDWSVLHLRSAQKVFSAGADLKTMRETLARPDGTAAFIEDIRRFQELFSRIESLSRVTFAEIGGAALGGGLELALACDLRAAAREARLGLPELRLGLLPGAGGTQRLTRLCGRGVAARLILGAEILDGAGAAALGIVQWAVPAAELPALAEGIARRVAGLPAHALAGAKSCIALVAPLGDPGFATERRVSRGLLESAETRGLVEAFLAGARR